MAESSSLTRSCPSIVAIGDERRPSEIYTHPREERQLKDYLRYRTVYSYSPIHSIPSHPDVGRKQGMGERERGKEGERERRGRTRQRGRVREEKEPLPLHPSHSIHLSLPPYLPHTRTPMPSPMPMPMHTTPISKTPIQPQPLLRLAPPVNGVRACAGTPPPAVAVAVTARPASSVVVTVEVRVTVSGAAAVGQVGGDRGRVEAVALKGGTEADEEEVEDEVL